MKKIMMTLAAIAVAATMNAQGYIGGSLGFNSDKTNDGKVTTTAFAIAPELGYKLDDKMAVGVALGFGYGKKKNDITDSETTTTTFDIKPYLRYQVLTFGKANIFVDGGVDFGLVSQKDYKPAMNIGLFVSPGIAYDINEKWSIVAHLNDMFSFGYKKSAVADVAGAPDPDTNINANLSTGGFQLGSLTFGVYYNF